MPIQYSGIISEHNWARTKAALFDICHMGEFIIEGDYLRSNMDKVVTTRLSDMPIGACRYGFMLNEDGGIIDDLVVYRLQREKWMLVVNAGTIEKDEVYLRNSLSKDSRVENVSDNTAKLDFQGPLSLSILKEIIPAGLESLRYYSFSWFDILGENNIISRTGYTGELGFELYISSGRVQQLWDLLLKDERVRPAGLGARDTLRLEMGYPLYGQDVDGSTTPVEAGFDKFLDYSKDFIGKEALLKQKSDGVKRQAICFKTVSRRSPRHNYKIYDRDREIGIVTSGSFSPSLGCGIGMGYINAGFDIASKILVKDNGAQIECAITDKPFYKHGSAKVKIN